MSNLLLKGADELIEECKPGRDMSPQEPVITVADNTMIIALCGDELNGGKPGDKKRVWARKTEGGFGRWNPQGLGLEFEKANY